MKSIAVICSYRIETDRIGGMDYFFWAFDSEVKKQGNTITWLFPNNERHGQYQHMKILSIDGISVEAHFVKHLQETRAQYDTIICHFLELCTPFYKRIKMLTNAKIIAVDHNPRPFGGYLFRKKIKKIIGSIVYGRYADLYVAVSNRTLQDFIYDFPFIPGKKLITIHNGLSIENISKRKTEYIRNGFHFMVSSHLRPEKGIDDVINALTLLPPSTLQHVYIDVYGDGPEKVRLNELITEKRLTSTIHLKGSTHSILNKYAEYDYLIHPSHAETFCYAVVESLLANLPVITTEKAGNILNLVKNNENGLTYPVGDIRALASILRDIVEKKQKMEIDMRETLTHEFSTETMVKRYTSLL